MPSGSVIAGHQLAVSPILLGILFENALRFMPRLLAFASQRSRNTSATLLRTTEASDWIMARLIVPPRQVILDAAVVLLYELLNLAVSFNGFLSMPTSKNFFNRYSEISFFSLFLKRNRPVLFRKD